MSKDKEYYNEMVRDGTWPGALDYFDGYNTGQSDQAERIATQLLGIDEISATNREMCHHVRQLIAELQEGYLEVRGQ